MTLRDWLLIWRTRWKIIVLFTVLGAVVAVVVIVTTPTTYQASTQVFVGSNASGNAFSQAQGAALAQAQAQTYAGTIDSPQVLNYVRNHLGITNSNADLTSRISATAQTNSTLITVSATDGSARFAATLANTAAQGFVQLVEGYTTPAGGTTPAVQLTITVPATTPGGPISPKPVAWTLSGLFVGLLLGAAAATLRELVDNRIKTPDDLSTAAEAPVMGIIVDEPQAAQHPIAIRNARAENFRQLRANLQFANLDRHPRVIAVTSSVPDEGKTSVTLNLGAALAEAGFAVCLVDADLRRPTLAKAVGLIADVGLTNVLIHELKVGDALQSIGPRLHVLASGPIPPNPSEVLSSTYTRDVIHSLLDRVDYVIVDTAPLLPVADGAEVAALADGALLVSRYNSTTEPQVRRAATALSGVSATVIGTILNRVPEGFGRGYDYGYYYYRPENAAETTDKAMQNRRPQPTPDRPRGGPEPIAADTTATGTEPIARANGRAGHRSTDDPTVQQVDA